MLLMCCSLVFMLFAINKKVRFEWLCLSMLCALLSLNILLTDVVGDARYIIRSSLIFLCACCLASRMSLMAGYQSFVLLLFLIANLFLMYDVAIGKDFLIYNNFESVIYGLITCQFVGVFILPLSKIWLDFVNRCSGHNIGHKNKNMDDTV